MNKKFSQTRQELLQSTVNYYTLNNRAVSGDTCAYMTEKGNRCAIGIECNKKLARELESMDDSADYGSSVKNDDMFSMLPKRLKKMGQQFLSSIQNLHDLSSHWDEEGISKEGKDRIKNIVEECNLKPITFK